MPFDPQQRKLFYDSLERCVNSRDFLDHFYNLFLASSQEIRDMFAKTDFKTQKRALKTSFYFILLASDGKQEGFAHLERIASVHKRINISPAMYDTWKDCLLRTVRERDPLWNNEIELAWAQMADIGIQFLLQNT